MANGDILFLWVGAAISGGIVMLAFAAQMRRRRAVTWPFVLLFASVLFGVMTAAAVSGAEAALFFALGVVAGSYETGQRDWPAVVVHVGAVGSRLVARVSSVPLAERVAGLLSATTNQRRPLVPSARFWFRVPM